MSETAEVPVKDVSSEEMHHEELNFWSKYVFSVDHKIIGFQYMFTGLFMALIGGYFAYAFRMQLAFPGQEVPFFGLVDPANITCWSPITAPS